MAVHIFGQTDANPEGALPFPDVDLPHPGTAPEATWVVGYDRLVELLGHDSAIVRAFAVRRLAVVASGDQLEPLLALIRDPSTPVARAAVDTLAEAGYGPAAEPLAELYREADGPVAMEAAVALGRFDPSRLAQVARERKRLDDTAYSATVMQLARSGHEAGHAFLTRSMDRAGALPPGRRVSLYASAMLSGAKDLVDRALRIAISESRDGQTAESAARMAVATAAGLPASMADAKAGKALIRTLTSELSPEITDDALIGFHRSLDSGDVQAALDHLQPVLQIDLATNLDSDRRGLATRARGLLGAVLDNRDAIEALGIEAAAVFCAAALDAAWVQTRSRAASADDKAVQALARALEIEPERVVSDAPDFEALFADLTTRQERTVVSALAGETPTDRGLVDAITAALLNTDHGEGLLDAAAESKTEELAAAVLRTFPKDTARAEAVVLEVLQRRPLEARPTGLALTLAGELATERLSLVIGRRFLDLREVERFRLVNAVLRAGDARLAPLMKARAFKGEPEEVAWTLLALIAGETLDGDLEETHERVQRGEPEQDGAIRLPLKCAACKETLAYGFDRIFVDPESKTQHGDPAFVGSIDCKACGAEDSLQPTELSVQMMTEDMVAFLVDAEQQGVETPAPRVMPRKMRFGGKEVGFGEALRQANADVEANPDSIRARLRRARIKLMLQRPRAEVDADAALQRDPKSPEALYVRAGIRSRDGAMDDARDDLLSAREHLRAEDEPRLYEESRESLLMEVELSLLRLAEGGVALPEGLDLSFGEAAQARVDQELARMRAAVEQRRQTDAAPGGAEPSQASLPPEAFKKVGRNEPCPCNSGKKFKKCHGRA